MKKIIITSTIAGILGTASFGVNATGIADGDTLSINTGGSAVTSCLLGTPLPCSNSLFNVTGQTGSFFTIGGSNANLSNFNGIILGTTQLASGSHSGPFNGTEQPGIDIPWEFSSNTGMHQSTSPINIISQTELDFTGWSVTWNGIADINLGGCGQIDPADNGGFSGCDFDRDGTDDAVNTGIANITITGDTYVLDYFANVSTFDPSGKGNAGYSLHLEGIIIHAVPVPAAVWLFGSGLLGLMGVARYKKRS